MSKPATNATASKTDWARVDAMTDADIVYDDDTGPPLTADEVADIVENGFKATGLVDFEARMKRAADAERRNHRS